MSRAPSRGLFAQVEAYFTEYLPRQRGASVHTVRAYRDALTLLFKFVADQRSRGVASLQLSDLDADAVTRFLDHIELERSNSPATRNCRRAAIRGFFKHLLRNDLTHSLQYMRVLATYFDPLPFYYAPLEEQATDLAMYPLNAVTQRPMAMYHSWDSQNAWLRQIHTHNYLFVNTQTAAAAGIADGGWMWVESPWGKVRCMCRTSEAVEPGTVWTWNAIGKAPGAWHLSPDANESQRGFLLNHLIREELPVAGGGTVSNSDPITGQAAWYDVRVRIRPAEAGEAEHTWPQPEAMQPVPGMGSAPKRRGWMAGLKGKR